VKKELFQFLSSAVPEVLCIKGPWGVGKTYLWKKCLVDASSRNGGIAVGRCAYVSLFGVNSLEELKYSIFENTVKPEQIAAGASLDTLKAVVESTEGLGRRHAWLLNLFPLTRNALAGAAPGLFLTVRNQIVCIDDLERKGNKLDAGDVLGLASFLKEERNCKVVLLLNDEALEQGDRQKFATYLEKVVDETLTFSPSTKEAVQIALAGKDIISTRIAENCTALGISNIRVIKKSDRMVQSIKPLLADFDDEVMRIATASLALFCWSHFQPNEAPTLSFLTERKAKSRYGESVEETLSPKEAAWNALLDSYGYVWTDDFDLVLIDGVKDGYFNPDKTKKAGKELHDKVLASKASNSFSLAWDKYHNSFDDNQDDVLDTMFAAFMADIPQIDPLNMNGTIVLFKQLGRNAQAVEMIEAYVAKRPQERAQFDLAEYPFANEVSDPDVVEAFRAKCESFKDTRDAASLMLDLKNKGFEEQTLISLAAIPVDGFYKAFKENEGRTLRQMIDASLQFNRILNATPIMLESSKRARAALEMIGKESAINARRVAKYGIKV